VRTPEAVRGVSRESGVVAGEAWPTAICTTNLTSGARRVHQLKYSFRASMVLIGIFPLDYFEMTTSDSTFVLNDDARTETPLENKNNIVWYGSAFKNALFLRERMSSSHGRV
jgi:hypothetical protein